MLRNLFLSVLCVLTSITAVREATACGGLFCDQSSVVIPPAQSSERIVFVVNAAGWNDAPEGMVAEATIEGRDPSERQPLEGQSVDAYIEIAYTGAAASFAWLVPLLQPPHLIGTARKEIFNDLDQATAPRFTFTYSSGSTSMGDSSGGCGMASRDSAMAGDGGGEDFEADPEVTVLGEGRVGPYEVAILESETAADLRAWLVGHSYELPATIEPTLQRYVEEGKTFVAFRLADELGVGAIEPVVIRTPGVEPCIPLRLTPVASMPELAVTAIIMGAGLVRPGNFSDAGVNENAVRPTSPFTSDYQIRLRGAVQGLGGLAVQTESATTAWSVEAADPISLDLLARVGFVTRLTTRIAPEEMTVDPIFVETGDQTIIPRDHVIDVTDDDAALVALGVQAAPPPAVDDDDGDRDDDGCSATGRATSPWTFLVLAPLALLVRRLRRR